MSRLQRNGLKEFAITEFYCNNIKEVYYQIYG